MTVDRLTERLYVTVDSRDEARFLSNASSVTDSDRRLLGSGKADLTLFVETANLSTEHAVALLAVSRLFSQDGVIRLNRRWNSKYESV